MTSQIDGADSQTKQRPKVKPFAKDEWIFANCFLIFWFGLAAVHISPPGHLYDKLCAALHPYAYTFLLSQHWGMFAPTTKNFNEKPFSYVTFQDGTVRMYDILDMTKLDQLERWKKGKLRELLIDYLLNKEKSKEHYPAICRYLAKASSYPENPVERVCLFGFWHRIPPPEDEFTNLADLPPLYAWDIFLEYKLEPGDLK